MECITIFFSVRFVCSVKTFATKIKIPSKKMHPYMLLLFKKVFIQLLKYNAFIFQIPKYAYIFCLEWVWVKIVTKIFAGPDRVKILC